MMPSFATIDPLSVAVVRLSLAALFMSSALHKARDRQTFHAAVVGYDLLPVRWTQPAAHLAWSSELLIGVALLIPVLSGAATVGAIGLLATYSVAITVNLQRGRTHIDCGCAGPAGRMPINRALLVRNALLMGACLLATLPSSPRALGLVDVVVIGVALPTFALLYAATETAIANAARMRESLSPVSASGNGGDPEGAPRARGSLVAA